MNELQQVYEATDVGLVRKGNEDNLAVLENVHVYAVADGMGGEAAGDVASQMLVDTVREMLSGRESVGEDDLCQAVIQANRAIRQYVVEHPGCEGMGTTATLLHIDDQSDSGSWAHVGDSRLYVLRQGSMVLEQITRDHSYVEDLVREGTITPEEAKTHPQRNMLTRAVGALENLPVDSGQLAVHGGDIFLLATDGLMKHVPDEEIVRLLRAGTENPARALVDAALSDGGTDNVTAVVVSLL
ncbi:Stp1/IreP family PP2C-type Ser/Thr phosphatase [Selenomonas ruminantium]|uniref:Stp1/IreP family PP2C-type Ser/Thr phosphatase n=1 Tax=Selenomonas ruminantium TaxID=971 RepID=UPI00210B102F|nr:Stp1/IreP family PP2C-type Ser/Thr phosphatase [Selenomonas ruminantium]